VFEVVGESEVSSLGGQFGQGIDDLATSVDLEEAVFGSGVSERRVPARLHAVRDRAAIFSVVDRLRATDLPSPTTQIAAPFCLDSVTRLDTGPV
jgi:hypothetical protein